MKYKTEIIVSVLLCLFSYGCMFQEDKNVLMLEQFFELSGNETPNIFDFDAIVVIPVEGCEICVRETIELVNSMGVNKGIHIIVQAYSKKAILNKLKASLVNSGNCSVDLDDYTYQTGLLTNTKPIVFFKDQGSRFIRKEVNESNKDKLFERLLTIE